MVASALDPLRSTSRLVLRVSSGDALDVRTFSVEEGISSLFTIQLTALSEDPDLDFAGIVGQPASFEIERAKASVLTPQRSWTGICTNLEQVGVEEDGQSTYALTIKPFLWLLTQRRNYRIFQQISEPDIVLEILAEWGIQPEVRIDATSYKARKYRVQYAESDFAFISRMMEDAGISYFFEDDPGGAGTKLVLTDAPQKASPRAEAIPFVATPNDRITHDFVTAVRVQQQVLPGRYTVRDHDYRRATDFALLASAAGGDGVESRLEQYHYVPGAMLFRSDQPSATPVADDRGSARHDPAEGQRMAKNRLDAKRGPARTCVFKTSATDLRPGQTMRIRRHPRKDLAEQRTLLVSANKLSGGSVEAWSQSCEARFTDVPFRPALGTPKPRTQGMESATVVGPDLEEIHTDEFGRVRVHFHWDRQSRRNERSSCWIHVNQPCGGSGFGSLTIPRVGQEVLVDFLSGDPDRPVVVGRVFTNLQRVPYDLPQYKTVSGMRSESTPRLLMGASGADSAARPPDSPLLGGARMTADEMAEEILKSRNFKAASPNALAHTWKGNEFTFDDKAGQEKVYLQAYKDLNAVVNDAWTSLVGNFRSTKVGSDDILSVRNKQQTSIGSDRSVAVGGSQTHTVAGNAFQMVEGNQVFKSDLNTTMLAKETRINSLDISVFTCGKSMIVMHPDFIVIQAKEVFINPGEEEANAAANGVRPTPQHEKDAQAAADAAARDQAVADRAQQERAAQDGYVAEHGYSPDQPAAQYANQFDAATSPDDQAYWDLKGMAASGGSQQLPTYGVARDYIMETYGLDSMQADTVVQRFLRG
ncbi:MAG: type VI secretion system tip protein VgrG [Myxococcales bacterium]|nr:type VI secretion system tip protein VgrG [Myxococcales bacterium]